MNKGFFSPKRLLLLGALLLAAFAAYRIWFVKPPQPDLIRVRVEALPKTLNPYLTTSGYTIHLSSRLFQSLGGFDPKTLALQPTLVKSIPKGYTVPSGPNKGLLAYDFELLEEAVWDNGTPITAKDMEFTLKMIFNPNIKAIQAYKGYFESVKTLIIDPANPKKFTVVFKEYYFIGLESLCNVPVFPKYHYDAPGNMDAITLDALLQQPIDSQLLADPKLKAFADDFVLPKYATDISQISGSNAYKVVLFNEQEIKLAKKDNWWGNKLADKYPQLQAYPKQIEYKLVTQDPTLEAMLKNGELEFADRVTPAKFIEWRDNPLLNSLYDFSTGWAPQYNKILLNQTNAKLADKRVRQALAYAVDYDYLINNAAKGLAKRIASPVSEERAYFNKNVPQYPFNIDKAKDLLSQAGWTDSNGDGTVDKMINGQRVELTLEFLTSNSVKIGEIVSASLEQSFKRAGIGLKIVSLESKEVLGRAINGQYECTLSATGISPTWIEFYQQYHSKSMAPTFGDNRSRFSNTTADSLIVLIRTTTDDAQRNAAYMRMQEILNDELPEIYLYSPLQRYIVSKKINGVISTNHPGYYETWFTIKK